MRITEAGLVPNNSPRVALETIERAQREALLLECRSAIALLQALTEKAQREVFCKRTLAEMHREILQARHALEQIERI